MKYVALFRGINVGGKNIVKMVDLRKLFSGLGMQDVHTYIQSGNVIFDTEEPKERIVTKIDQAFQEIFGFKSPVLLRTKQEMKDIIGELPFSVAEIAEAAAEHPDVEHLYVYFLDDARDSAEIERVKAAYAGRDKLRIGKREAYLLCVDSIRNSRLAAALSAVPTPLTARNWKTVERLYGSME